MVLKCYNKATVPLKNLSCFSPYGNLTPPHWYSLSSSSRMAHFRKVLHKANSPTGGNTGEEAGRQAICRGTEGLRRSGRGQRGRAAPSVGGQPGLSLLQALGEGPARGTNQCRGTSRRTGPWARSKPRSSGQRCASTQTCIYIHTHTQCTNTHVHT